MRSVVFSGQWSVLSADNQLFQENSLAGKYPLPVFLSVFRHQGVAIDGFKRAVCILSVEFVNNQDFSSGRVGRRVKFNPIPAGLWYIAIVANNGVARRVKHENTSASARCGSPGSGLQWLRALLLQRSVLSTVRLLPAQSAGVLRSGTLCRLWLLPWLLSALPRQVVICSCDVDLQALIALIGV